MKHARNTGKMSRRGWLPLLAAVLLSSLGFNGALPVFETTAERSSARLRTTGISSSHYARERVGEPASNELPASPADLLRPDKFQFYAYNERGDMITRQMTAQEIQALIAGGGASQAAMEIVHEPQKTNDVFSGGKNVMDVVQKVQSVLKSALDKPQAGPAGGALPTIPAQANAEWSNILPSILSGDTDSMPISGATETASSEPSEAEKEASEAPEAPEAPASSSATPLISSSEKPEEDHSQGSYSPDKPMIPVPVITAEEKLTTTRPETSQTPLFQILAVISDDSDNSNATVEQTAAASTSASVTPETATEKSEASIALENHKHPENSNATKDVASDVERPTKDEESQTKVYQMLPEIKPESIGSPESSASPTSVTELIKILEEKLEATSEYDTVSSTTLDYGTSGGGSKGGERPESDAAAAAAAAAAAPGDSLSTVLSDSLSSVMSQVSGTVPTMFYAPVQSDAPASRAPATETSTGTRQDFPPKSSATIFASAPTETSRVTLETSTPALATNEFAPETSSFGGSADSTSTPRSEPSRSTSSGPVTSETPILSSTTSGSQVETSKYAASTSEKPGLESAASSSSLPLTSGASSSGPSTVESFALKSETSSPRPLASATSSLGLEASASVPTASQDSTTRSAATTFGSSTLSERLSTSSASTLETSTLAAEKSSPDSPAPVTASSAAEKSSSDSPAPVVTWTLTPETSVSELSTSESSASDREASTAGSSTTRAATSESSISEASAGEASTSAFATPSSVPDEESSLAEETESTSAVTPRIDGIDSTPDPVSAISAVLLDETSPNVIDSSTSEVAPISDDREKTEAADDGKDGFVSMDVVVPTKASVSQGIDNSSIADAEETTKLPIDGEVPSTEATLNVSAAADSVEPTGTPIDTESGSNASTLNATSIEEAERITKVPVAEESQSAQGSSTDSVNLDAVRSTPASLNGEIRPTDSALKISTSTGTVEPATISIKEQTSAADSVQFDPVIKGTVATTEVPIETEPRTTEPALNISTNLESVDSTTIGTKGEAEPATLDLKISIGEQKNLTDAVSIVHQMLEAAPAVDRGDVNDSLVPLTLPPVDRPDITAANVASGLIAGFPSTTSVPLDDIGRDPQVSSTESVRNVTRTDSQATKESPPAKRVEESSAANEPPADQPVDRDSSVVEPANKHEVQEVRVRVNDTAVLVSKKPVSEDNANASSSLEGTLGATQPEKTQSPNESLERPAAVSSGVSEKDLASSTATPSVAAVSEPNREPIEPDRWSSEKFNESSQRLPSEANNEQVDQGPIGEPNRQSTSAVANQSSSERPVQETKEQPQKGSFEESISEATTRKPIQQTTVESPPDKIMIPIAQSPVNREEITNATGSEEKLTKSETQPATPATISAETPESSKVEKVEKIEKSEPEKKWTLVSQQKVPGTASATLPATLPATTGSPEGDNREPEVALDASGSANGLDASVRGTSSDIVNFSRLCNELAFSFWTATNKGLSTGRSLALSPFGMTSLLAMIFLGARGPTSEQMNELLRLDDVATFNPHLIFQNVTDAVGLSRGQGVANAAFVRELFADKTKVRKLMPFYKEQAQQFYEGLVAEVNFATIGDLVRRRTNLLIRKQTGGRIKDFVKANAVPLRSPLAALSANVFQTDCNSSVASSAGRDGELYFAVSPAVRQRKLVPVPATVWRSGVLAGYEPSLDATAAALGGHEKLVSTIFVLPGQQGHTAPGDSLDRLEQRLVSGAFANGAWDKLLRVLAPRHGLELQLPKFSHRSVVNATAALKRMGLDELFSKHADLKGINGVGNRLHLADVLQMNLFSTCGDESITNGRHHVEIYPASPVKNARSFEDDAEDESDASEPRDGADYRDDGESRPARGRERRKRQQPERPRLKLDRPFLYFVRHNPTGLILHMGRFNPRLLP